jgi:S-adenosylmethionine hydrolase
MPATMAGPFISFLTDFGSAATAPAVCRGVILGLVPDARILDLTHDVRPFAVRDGAFLLWSAIPYLPVGVHLVVVDPGVGTERRGVVLRAARGDLLVGPDNGVLRPAAERLGGITEARALTNPRLWRDEVSSTFHGRDLFAPVAARLAAGTPLTEAGAAVPVDELLRLEFPTASVRDEALETAVLFIDTFGNCRLAGDEADLAALLGGALEDGRSFRVLCGATAETVPFQRTFGRVGEGAPLLYRDADYGGLGLAINQGSAAERFGLALDSPVRIEPA